MEQFLLYKNSSGEVKVEVMLQNETLWLTQKALAELFQVGIPAVAKHIKISMKVVNLMNRQLFPKWKQFETKERELYKKNTNTQA